MKAPYLARLGITDAHCHACKLPIQDEAIILVDAGLDVFDRPQKMTPETCSAWREMQATATAEGVSLRLVSAYRSVDYQCRLIQQKLAGGQGIDEILKVNAIPGYSEHHTGRALDLTTLDAEPLTESFDTTVAFAWLSEHAAEFGFILSYPKNNTSGIDYEPWHWAFCAKNLQG